MMVGKILLNNRDLLKNILKLAKQNLNLHIVGFVFVIIHSFAVLLSPAASGYLIDKTLASNSMSDMVVGVCFFCLAIIGQPIFGFFKDVIYMKIILNLNAYNSLEVFKKIIFSPIEYFEKTMRGEIISKLINDTKEISSFVSKFFTVLIKNFILTILIIGSMFYISIKITTIVLLMLIVFFIINKKLNDRLEDLSMKVVNKNDLLYSKVTQTVTEIESIKCFCGEERVCDSYKKILDDIRKVNNEREMLAITIRNFSTLVIMVSLSLIYFLGCMDVLNGDISVGNVITLGLYYQLIMGPLFEIVGCVIDMNNIKPIFNRFNKMMHMQEERRYNEDIIISNFNDIHFENVSFGYNDTFVLKDICLHTPDKGLIGIIGKSGAGKSTLMKLLIGFYRPQQGKISIANIDLNDVGCYNLRQKISFVSQDIVLFSSSINDNFWYANKELSYQEIMEYCKKVNLHEKIMSTEKKYDTTISEMSNISGGEKQRIGIAMALARKSSIILLDEPTSALDPANEDLIVHLLKEESKEKLVIVISHKETTLKSADKVYSLQDGRLMEVIL